MIFFKSLKTIFFFDFCRFYSVNIPSRIGPPTSFCHPQRLSIYSSKSSSSPLPPSGRRDARISTPHAITVVVLGYHPCCSPRRQVRSFAHADALLRCYFYCLRWLWLSVARLSRSSCSPRTCSYRPFYRGTRVTRLT